MSRLYVYATIVAATLGLAAWAAASIYNAGKVAGAADCEQAHAKAAAEAQAESTRREQASSDARTSMLNYLAAEKPAIEIRTHDTITEIRKVYVDRPLPAECIRPASVQASLDKARDSANAAIGRM